MADVYKVTYNRNKSSENETVNVSATSLANAVAAAKTNDSSFKQHVSATVIMHNVVSGS
jgi:hypothetical protein